MPITLTHLARSTTGTSTSVTVPSGTKMLLMLNGAEASATPLTANSYTPTHSGSDVWVEIVERLNRTAAPSGTTNAAIGAAYILNPTAGTFTVGVSNTNGWGGSNGYIQVYAVDGDIDMADPIGGVGYGSANNSTETVISFNEATGTVDASASLVTEVANSLLIAAMITNDLETWTLSGWTEDFNVAGTGVAMTVRHRQDQAAATNLGATTWTASTATNRATTVQFEIRAASAAETITVDPGTVTIAGQTVDVADVERVTVDPGAVGIAGQTVDVLEHERVTVDPGSMTLAGQTVDVVDGESIPVDPGTLAIQGQTVDVTDIGTEVVTVDPGTLTITGQEVTVTEIVFTPPRNRAIGGGTGPADPRFIKAEQARRDRETDLWRRIDDDLHGRQREKPQAAPEPPQRSRKPLPETVLPPIGAEIPDFDALLQAMSQDGVSTLMLRHDLPFYDPEEDAAVLLLLS